MAIVSLRERNEKSLKEQLIQMSVGMALWFSAAAYLLANQAPAQASPPREKNHGFRPAPEWATKEWQFDPDNPIDWRILAMDAEEPFIGMGDKDR